MTNSLKTQIVQQLEQYIEKHGISQNELAKRTGVNAAYLIAMRKGDFSVVVNGKEVTIADSHFEKIAEFIGFQLRKTYWETRPTEQLVETMAILEDAKRYGYTNTIIGDTGCGKSYAIELFRQKNPNDTYIVTVSQLDKIGDILDKIIDVMKLTETKGNTKKMRSIIERLRNLKLEGKTRCLFLTSANI